MKAPDTKRIVWQMPDGSTMVTIPFEPMLDGESEADYLGRIAAKTQAKVPLLKDAVRIADITREAHAAMLAERIAAMPPDPGPLHERLAALENRLK